MLGELSQLCLLGIPKAIHLRPPIYRSQHSTMPYDFRGSPEAHNGQGSSSSLPGYSCRSSSAMESGRGVAPAQMYQQVVAELEAARRQIRQLSTENQRLRSLHQQLSGEIASISQEFQGQLGHALKRLQQVGQSAQAAASEGGSQPFQPTRIPEPNPSEAPLAYDFLNRLKRRQSSNGTLPFLSNGYSEPYTPNPGFTTPSDPSCRPAPSRPEASVPPSPVRPCNDTPTESYSRTGYQVPALDELIQDMGGSDPYGEAYPTGVYQRIREQHHGSQGSTVLWIAAAVILVVGSFGLGFMAVQPFLRNDPPPPSVRAR